MRDPADAGPAVDESVRLLRATLDDQGSAIDSLERRALALMAPIAFVLGLAINNVSRANPRLSSTVVYYGGLVLLIAALLAGAATLWNRRPLNDPTLVTPRHEEPLRAAALMADAADRNLRYWRAKTLTLRAQLTCLVGGCCLVVFALGLVS